MSEELQNGTKCPLPSIWAVLLELMAILIRSRLLSPLTNGLGSIYDEFN
jgi:hypothetical protein